MTEKHFLYYYNTDTKELTEFELEALAQLTDCTFMTQYIQYLALNTDEKHEAVEIHNNIIYSNKSIPLYDFEDIAMQLTDIEHDTVDFVLHLNER